MALRADKLHAAGGHAVEQQRVHIEKAMVEQQMVGVVEHGHAMGKVPKPPVHHRRRRGGPRLGKTQLIVFETFALAQRHVERRMTAQRERQHGAAGVQDLESLPQCGSALNGIGYMQAECIREGRARLLV